MARLPKDIVLTSPPVRTFPNGDYLFVELTRRAGPYNCTVKMAPAGDRQRSVVMVSAEGRTIREAEDRCYLNALDHCPRFPKPPYLHRGSGSSRTQITRHTSS